MSNDPTCQKTTNQMTAAQKRVSQRAASQKVVSERAANARSQNQRATNQRQTTQPCKTPPKSRKKPVSRNTHNKSFGRRGEEAAARFLVSKGYDIVARNWSCFAGEVDIVARDEKNLVFVEVKTRSSIEKGFPSEAVTRAKRERYEKIALAYLADHDEVGLTVRFDVIALVAVASDRALIRHHINAFGVQ